MNIFYIDSDPKKCAEWAVDKHVTKMILESAQLLSTAHRVLDGIEHHVPKPLSNGKWRTKKHWILLDEREELLYSATHVNHPSSVWTRESNNNYNWLWHYLYEHCKEYTHRYGKSHKVERDNILAELSIIPNNIPIRPFTQPPQAMPDEYKGSDTVEAYRKYYKYGKAHLHSWKNREVPFWILENKCPTQSTSS